MKKWIYMSFLCLVLLPSFSCKLFSQSLSDEQKMEVQEEITAQLKRIEADLEDGKRSLESAEMLYDRANQHLSLIDRVNSLFLGILGLLLAIVFGVGLLSYRSSINRITEHSKGLIEDKVNLLIDEANKTKREVERLLLTEAETIGIKKQTALLFYGDRSELDFPFLVCKNIFKPELVKRVDKDATINSIINRFDGFDTELKLLVLDDESYKTQCEAIESNISVFNNKNIGMFLSGNALLSDKINEELKFVQFANKPSTFYTNINGLLKYMNTVKDLI